MPRVPETVELAELELFRDLTPGEMARLQQHLGGTSFPAGTNLFSVDQPGEVAYIILSGTVKVSLEPEDGSEVILSILGPGQVVGELSVVDRLGRSANVITMEETSVLWIGRAALWECLRTMPVLACNLVGILSRRLRLANAQVESLATRDVYGRVARQLLALADEYGGPAPGGGVVIPLRLTQSDLAGMVGASRVRVNQVVVSYQRSGYITVDQRHHITVHDREGLSDYL